jgi:hypothetical protein
MSVASSLTNSPTPATPPDAAAPSESPAPLKRSRLWIVYGLLAVIVVGHLVEVVTQREHWPFSPYQMWSKP